MKKFFSKKQGSDPFNHIMTLSKNIEKLKQAVFSQKSGTEFNKIIASVIHEAAEVIATDAQLNYIGASKSEKVNSDVVEGTRQASTRNTAVAMTAMACVCSALLKNNNFTDDYKNYIHSHEVVTGKRDFSEVENYGYLMKSSIHKKD